MDYLLLLILGTLWGGAPLLVKLTVAEVPVLTQVAYRLVLSAAILWGVVRVQGLTIPRQRQTWIDYAIMGLFNIALPYSLISWAVQYIPSGLAAMLHATTPIFAVLLAHFFTADERLSLTRLAGVIAGFVGVGLQMLPSLSGGLQASLWAQLAVVAASLGFAATAIFARNRFRGQHPLVSAAGLITMGAAWMLPASLIVEGPLGTPPSLPVMGAWLGLAIFSSALGQIIYMSLIARTSATFAMMVTYLMPVDGLILGALVLAEPLGPTALASLALILLGVFLVNRPPKRDTMSYPPGSGSTATRAMEERSDGEACL